MPVLQTMQIMTNREFWWETSQAVTPMDVCMSFAQPEFDGNLIGVPLSTREVGEKDPLTGAVLTRMQPLPERAAKTVRLALNWANLGQKPNAEKRWPLSCTTTRRATIR